MNRRYELYATFFALMALIAGMIASALYGKTLEEQHQEAVNAGVYDMVVTETERYEITTTTTTAVATTYFDIPLSRSIQDHIFAECERYDLPPEIIIAMIERESDFDPDNMGDNGQAYGLMQIHPRWHSKRMEKLNCTNLLDPYQNITVGVDYLAELLDKYDGNIAHALTAYNQGSYKGTITNYAKSILKNSKEVKTIYD